MIYNNKCDAQQQEHRAGVQTGAWLCLIGSTADSVHPSANGAGVPIETAENTTRRSPGNQARAHREGSS